jgi:hypothetical protein
VRRQADRDPRTRSLRVLICEMRDNAELFTRDYFVGLLGDQTDNELMVQRAHEGFDRFAGTGDHLDPRIPTADIDSLDRDATLVKGFVDQHLAHTQAEPNVRIPTFAELDEAIDSVGEMFKKYAATLTGAAWLMLDEPTFQYDWKAVFRVPWIASDGDESRI